jgi:hypothetical protein
MHIETGHSITQDARILDGVCCVRFVEGGRTVFEVSINKEAASIEIRSVERVKVDEVLYDQLKMSVSPQSANCINVSLLPF